MLTDEFPLVTTLEVADTCPTVSPAWRWKAALALVENPSRYYRSADPEILEAIAFLQGEELENRLVIQQAQLIHEQDELLRAKIESLVLASVSTAEIATRCKLSSEIVEKYEELFFAVRRYPKAVDWRLSCTVGRAHWDGFQNHQIRQFWAWLAIAGGPVVAEFAITTYEAIARRKDTFCLLTYFKKEAEVPVSLLAFIAKCAIPTDEEGMQVCQDLGFRDREIKACSDPDVQRQMREKAQQAAIEYVRQALRGKPRKWTTLTGTSPASEKKPESRRA